MASKKLQDMLNMAISREIQVSIQYMWRHVRATGIESLEVTDRLKKIAVTEMKHAEAIAERLDYLGGEPTTEPAPIKLGESLSQMIDLDIKAEEEAIALYRDIIKLAMKEEDFTTKKLFEGILADEEEHHNEFRVFKGQ
ncbi:MAG TPA: ferritin [Candidatus Acetothermia bacterium]|nr:ferritin [Candidatus Acetothermia bacterium]